MVVVCQMVPLVVITVIIVHMAILVMEHIVVRQEQ